MMKNEEQVNEHLQWFKEFYTQRIGKNFPDDRGMGEFYNDIAEQIAEIINNEAKPRKSLRMLKDLSRWHRRYSQYLLLHKQNPTASLEEFTKSAIYAYLSIRAGDESFRGWGKRDDEFELMNNYVLYVSQSILCGWWDNGYDLNDRMITSIDYTATVDERGKQIQRIIQGGQSDVPASWFLLELYCKVNHKEFNRDNADYPESMVPYDQVLDKWDTRDLVEVDRLVYLMGDTHLEQAQEEKNEGDFFEFGFTSTELFPYEILTWLAYRTKAGLKNPTEFSHPLMNTPLARMFLELKEPLAKPTELPYAKELLTKLKEACPQIEVEI